MKTVSEIILLCVIFLSFKLLAQGNVSPGVSRADWDAIQSQVTNLFGAPYLVSDIVNVDSAVGNRRVADGKITNPYNTLTGSYIFVACEIGENTSILHGVIGIYKTGNIIWNSDTIINSTSRIGASITATRDLNNDGKVEIITSIFEGPMGDIEVFWIFDWNGVNGSCINSTNSENESPIISETSGFDFFDIDGNDVFEITGWWYPDESAEETEKIIYSWNGSLYGKWTPPPQPLPSGFYPRNKVNVTIKTKFFKSADTIYYKYELQNKSDSKQEINEFILCTSINSVLNFRSPNKWIFCRVDGRAKGWAAISGFDKFIVPGKSDSSFLIKSYDLPCIMIGLIRGDNGDWTDIHRDVSQYTPGKGLDEALTNSLTIKTVGPTNHPNPFIPITFLDTLTSYTTQSRTLGWIKNQTTANKYLGYFASAKTLLQTNKTDSAKQILTTVVANTISDSMANITSEAYALLRFNSEYLITKIVPLDTLRVPSQYSTIQSAINAADSGKTVLVSAGTYNERDTINSKVSLKLMAADTNITINGVIISNSSDIMVKGFKIYAFGNSQDGVQLTGNQNTNVTIEANDIQNSSRNGISISTNNSNINIVNNVIANNSQDGICLANGALGTQYVVNNTIVKNGKCGIEAVGPQNLSIINNIIIYDRVAGKSGERLVRGTGTYIRQRNNLVITRQSGVVQSNFRLLLGSIAIDKGTTSVTPLPTKDKDGKPRVSGTTIDVGAYEY